MARIRDGFNPLDEGIYQPVQQEGACRLLRKVNPFCDPLCAGGTVCSVGGECVPEPGLRSVGSMTAVGLVEPLLLEPLSDGSYRQLGLPDPPFAPGARIRVTASGGELAGFTLRGIGVAPLVVAPGVLTIRPGQSLEIAWDSDGTVDSLVAIDVRIDQHGNSPLNLHCDAPDTGSFAVPAALLDTMRTDGVTGYPHAYLERRTADSVAVPQGCIDLRVSQQSGQIDVEVEGHYPCLYDGDCPEGLTCDEMTQSCVPL